MVWACSILFGLLGCEPQGDKPVPIENNTAPSAPTVTLVPPHPVPGGGQLQCKIGQASVDDQLDTVIYSFLWAHNGVAIEANGDLELPGDSVSLAEAQIGDRYDCTAVPTDGELEGESGAASATVRAQYLGWGGGDLEVDQADYIFEGEGIGTQAGRIFRAAGDVDGDGLEDILLNAHKNESVGFFAGKSFLILGSSLGESGVFPLSEADYGFEGEREEDFAGHGIDRTGDIDGDGLDDFLISSYLHDWDGWDRGKVYVQYGAELGTPSHRSLADGGVWLEGEDNGDRLGHGVCGAGDMDGDGLMDIAMGAYGNDHHGPMAGKGYVFLGQSLKDVEMANAVDADHSFYGRQPGAQVGYVCSTAGDVDADGLADLLIAARFEDAAEVDAGQTYLVLGGNLGTAVSRPMDSVFFSVEGEGEGDICCGLGELGDLDGDGRSDLLMGSHFNDTVQRDGGAAYVVLASTVARGGVLSLSEADYRMYGVMGGNETGHGVSGAGDVTGDGVIDLLVGAPGHTPGGSNPASAAGRVYLVSGQALLSQSEYPLQQAAQTFSSTHSLELVGWGVDGGVGNDMNGDGVPDVFVGSANEDPDGISRAYLFLTPTESQ